MARTIAIYDASCGLCRRAGLWLRRLDLWGHLEVIASDDRARIFALGLEAYDERALGRDFHVFRGDGPPSLGYAAYGVLVRTLPLLWIVWPIWWLGRVTGLGPRVYRRVAEGRVCAVNNGGVGRHR